MAPEEELPPEEEPVAEEPMETPEEDREEDAPWSLGRGRRRRLLLTIVAVYVIAVAVVLLGLYFLTPSTPASACEPGALPAVNATLAGLAANDTAFPPPAKGSTTPESFELWVNTTPSMPAHTNLSFHVQDLSGASSPALCRLPIPSSGWSASPNPLSAGPSQFLVVHFTGQPSSAYGRTGLFGVQVWVNETAGGPMVGSLYVLFSVG